MKQIVVLNVYLRKYFVLNVDLSKKTLEQVASNPGNFRTLWLYKVFSFIFSKFKCKLIPTFHFNNFMCKPIPTLEQRLPLTKLLGKHSTP